MHRPLQPPPGYEHYHTEEAVFPGRRHKLKKINSLGDLRDQLSKAWRLYKHYYIPDPEMTKWERGIDIADERRTTKSMWKTLKRGEQMANRGVDRAGDVFEQVREEVKNRRPEAEELMKDRVSVLKVALQEFSEGYSEVVSGARSFWGDPPYDEVLVRKDNRPLVCKAEGEPE